MDSRRVTFRTHGKTVFATIDDCETDALQVFTEKYVAHFTSSLALIPSMYDERFIMPTSFTAKAQCSIDDKFDYEAGKKIALDRLTKKYHRSLNRHLANILCTMDNALMMLNKDLEGKNF